MTALVDQTEVAGWLLLMEVEVRTTLVALVDQAALDIDAVIAVLFL